MVCLPPPHRLQSQVPTSALGRGMVDFVCQVKQSIIINSHVNICIIVEVTGFIREASLWKE